MKPASVASAPRRRRQRPNGDARPARATPAQQAARARNGRPKVVHIKGAGTTSLALRHAALSRGTRLGRAYDTAVQEFTAHVGGEPSAVMKVLIDRAARAGLLAQIAWAEVVRVGAFRNGEPRGAFDAYRRAAADEREVLKLLGIQRQARPVQAIEDYEVPEHG